MKIAVTYDEGNIFQHFGRTENFKIYEVEGEQVLSTKVVATNGSGHGALAGILAELDVEVLICGGIGGGAQAALAEAGIVICSGAEGDADEAVEAYLKGELESAGINCDHHHEEEHDCGSEEGGCGGGCSSGGCGGGCGGCGGGQQTNIEGKNVGRTVRAHYRGTFNDGSVFDSSYDRGEPLEFVCGVGMMIRGFDEAVANMEIGDEVDIHLMPEEAYGMPNPNAIFTVPMVNVPGSEALSVGDRVVLTNSMGQPIPVAVKAKDEENITFDANHEMAGKELNFHISLVSVDGSH